MNRKEAIKIIEENRIFYRDFKKEQFDEALEYLKQPITLNDFFNFEENVEYEFNGIVYKVCNNNLFYSSPLTNNWLICLKFQDLEELRKIAEHKKKRHNLILKSALKGTLTKDGKKFILKNVQENTKLTISKISAIKEEV